MQGIRGACASASLKQQRRGRRCERGGEHPRRMRLGLIEALFSLPIAALPAAHPRRMRLGLIEAEGGRRCFTPPGEEHPRRMRLGLIEALAWPRDGRPCR